MQIFFLSPSLIIGIWICK